MLTPQLYIFIQIYLVATDQLGTILLLSCRSQGETTLGHAET